MFKKEIIILYYGLRDKRTAVIAGLPVIISVIYLLSPIDLIPDFIPFFGYIDDFIVISLLLNLSIRLLPGEVREESLLKASRHRKKLTLIFFLIVIFLLPYSQAYSSLQDTLLINNFFLAIHGIIF